MKIKIRLRIIDNGDTIKIILICDETIIPKMEESIDRANYYIEIDRRAFKLETFDAEPTKTYL